MGLIRTLSERSMPIFMVPADDGQVPHAPWQPHQRTSSPLELNPSKCTTSAAKGDKRMWRKSSDGIKRRHFRLRPCPFKLCMQVRHSAAERSNSLY